MHIVSREKYAINKRENNTYGLWEIINGKKN
jgi:hypothetical protein